MITTQRADRVVLHSLDWPQFENILQTLGQHRAARIAYYDGDLEIMSPLPEHEYYIAAISIVVEDVAEVLEYDYECYGSSTWKRAKMQAGVEPDNCFYFQNQALVRGKLNFDLEKDPPPDLVLEVDFTSKSIPRMPIYARLGVPELWCYDSGKLTIYRLQQGQYIPSPTSAIFPALRVQEIPQLIEQYRPLGRRSFRQAVKAWINAQLAN